MEKKVFFLILLFFFQNNFLSFSYGQVVVINEICTSPPGFATTNSNSLYNTAELPSDNQEWIELYNPNPCNSVDISCYTLGGNMYQSTVNGPAPNWGAFTFPAGTVIPPAGFIIVGGNNAQVPLLEFNTTLYRQTSFGVQYLDGDPTRWFLRDEYGWVALYNPSGTVVDAVYWDAYGNAANLNIQTEYQQNIVTTTSCSGTQSLAAARNIAGIEYVGASIAGSYYSFQRTIDGAATWFAGPVTPSPHVCNGPCVTAPLLDFVVVNEHCNSANGSIAMTITDGHSGPYTTNWINPPGLHTNTINNLSAGTYIVQVVDAYNCFIVYDTITITNTPGPEVAIDSIRNEMCSAADAAIFIHGSNGITPYTYLWNSNPPQTGQNLSGVHAGNYTVTLTDANGCKAYADTSLSNTPPPTVSFTMIKPDTCNKRIGALQVAVSGGNPPYVSTWNFDSTNHSNLLTHLSEGIYTVTVSDNFCSTTASLFLENIPGPQADFLFYPRVATIEDPIIRFEDWSTGDIDHWFWDFGDMKSSIEHNPFHRYDAIGDFDVMLKISNSSGCVDSVIKQVHIVDPPSLFIPNCFTPNGDGKNDFFFVAGNNIVDFTLYLYDRWGELVYTSHNIDDHWYGQYKGRVVPEGIYSYVIFYTDNYAGQMMLPQTKSGMLTVIF